MNSRLEALISRGYSKEMVIKLSSFTEDDLNYASNCAFSHISNGCTFVENPSAIFIGGQPGCGKTVLSMKIKNTVKNAIEIGIDNYRMYHPNYLEIEDCIREHWKNRVETSNDSPGNDIADFTHLFAGKITDRLIELGKKNKYNLILEWGMREPTEPLSCMTDLKNFGYVNTVIFIATPKTLSYEACQIRANVLNNNYHIIRKVPESFHNICVKTLPDSINKIYLDGFSNNVVDYMAIIDRNDKIVWDNNSQLAPSKVYSYYLNNKNIKDNNNNVMAIKTTIMEMVGLKSIDSREINSSSFQK